MFRRLIMAIFRLYMKYLLSSYTKHTWVVYIGQGEDKVGTRSRISQKRLGGVGYMRGPCCYQAMSKPIIVKYMVGIALCLCVLCNYTKV